MLIDSHCHLSEKNHEEIVKEAYVNGVIRLIAIGTSISENKKTLEIANLHENVFASLGIYPHEEHGKNLYEMESNLEDILRTDKNKKIVSIGECGIDISDGKDARELSEQLEIFEMQINLALKYKKPVVIHNRGGTSEILSLVKRYSGVRFVNHCFSYDWNTAKKLLDQNIILSFSGMVTYPSRKELMDVVSKVPSDKYLLETDSPYLPPQGHRGEENQPKYVKIVAEKVAQIRVEPFDLVCNNSYSNTCAFFNL